MKKQIITDRNILKQKSVNVTPDEALVIIKDLEDTLDIKRGLGLSAIQIGTAKNVSIIRHGNTKIDLINAYIVEKEDKFRFQGEGCLSMPGIRIDTMRYNRIKINNNGKENEYQGLLAVAIFHEVDHQKGITILDRKWRAR